MLAQLYKLRNCIRTSGVVLPPPTNKKKEKFKEIKILFLGSMKIVYSKSHKYCILLICNCYLYFVSLTVQGQNFTKKSTR